MLLEKIAVWTVSGTGVGVPFATVTQMLGLALVVVHPVWKVIGVEELALVMLYSAVNSRPVVGATVRPDPTALAAAKWSVSIVSTPEHTAPCFKIPLSQSRRIVGVPRRTLPVRSIPTGLRTAWFARRIMSNPFRLLEF